MGGNDIKLNEESLLNHFVEFKLPYPDGRHRIGKVIEVGKTKKWTLETGTKDKTVKRSRAVKVLINGTDLARKFKVPKKTMLVPLEWIRTIFLKKSAQGPRRGIPFDEWCLRNPKEASK